MVEGREVMNASTCFDTALVISVSLAVAAFSGDAGLLREGYERNVYEYCK